jgi:hypothetical protein
MALTIVFALSACATSPYPTNYRRTAADGYERASGTTGYTAQERRLRSQSSFFSKSSVQGCLAGAALVGLATALLSDDSRKVAIGAAAGCAAGLGVNAYVQNQRRRYLSREQQTRAILADLRRDNRKLEAMIDTSREVMEADRGRIASVDRAYREKEISAARARAELRRVKANREQVGEHLRAVREKEAFWEGVARQTGRGAGSAQLGAEVEKFRAQRAALEEEYRLQGQLINASPVAG